jgi:hypothetical protein
VLENFLHGGGRNLETKTWTRWKLVNFELGFEEFLFCWRMKGRWGNVLGNMVRLRHVWKWFDGFLDRKEHQIEGFELFDLVVRWKRQLQRFSICSKNKNWFHHFLPPPSVDSQAIDSRSAFHGNDNNYEQTPQLPKTLVPLELFVYWTKTQVRHHKIH